MFHQAGGSPTVWCVPQVMVYVDRSGHGPAAIANAITAYRDTRCIISSAVAGPCSAAAWQPTHRRLPQAGCTCAADAHGVRGQCLFVVSQEFALSHAVRSTGKRGEGTAVGVHTHRLAVGMISSTMVQFSSMTQNIGGKLHLKTRQSVCSCMWKPFNCNASSCWYVDLTA